MAVFALTLVLRSMVFPDGHAPPATDEFGYLGDGLLLLEGVTPAYKFAPSGPLTWFTALIGGLDTLRLLLVGDPALNGVPGLLKPGVALDAVLFKHYADLATLRVLTVAMIVALFSYTAFTVARWGAVIGGAAGAIVAGGLLAGMPILIEFSTETRPYAVAWSLALLALVAAGGDGQRRIAGAGVLIGLAVGTRIEMVMLGPLVLLLQWRAAGGRPPWRDFAVTIATAALAFLVVAPWYLPHLVGNLRLILSIRLLDSQAAAEPAWKVFLREGLALPLLLTLAGLAVCAMRRRWPEALAGLWLLLLTAIAFRPSVWGLHHDGALVVATISLSPLAIHALGELLRPARRGAIALTVATLVIAPTIVLGVRYAWELHQRRAADESIAWIEHNVAAGSTVFVVFDRIDVPLPTADAAERIWQNVAQPDAWRDKLRFGLDRFGLDKGVAPRALSEELMYQERGLLRRFYILGAPYRPDRPRYDLWIVPYSKVFGVRLADAVRRVCADGGTLLFTGEPIAALPAPAASWPHPDGFGTKIYVVQPGACPHV